MSFVAYAVCPECGMPIRLGEVLAHECDHTNWIAYQVAKARSEIQEFEAEFAAYAESPLGRFDVFYAARTRAVA